MYHVPSQKPAVRAKSTSSWKTSSVPAASRFAVRSIASCTLDERERALGVVAASAGNHIRGSLRPLPC